MTNPSTHSTGPCSDFEESKQDAANLSDQLGSDDPLPLQRSIEKTQPYPFERLGPILGPAARRIHEVVQAPDSVCGQSILAAAALVAQSHADICIDGRTYPLSLYAITIAESGERKSAVDSLALYPAREWQKQLVRVHREDRHKYANEYESWKVGRSAALKNQDEKERNSDLKRLIEPTRPLEPMMICEEPTYEGLVKALDKGQPSMGLFTDEGGRFLGGHAMNRDNCIKTAAGLSNLWDGKPVTRMRGGDENLILYGRRLSLHLMVQPSVFQRMGLNGELVGQGILARCLIVHPQSMAGKRLYEEVDLSSDPFIQAYHDRYSKLLDCPFHLVDGTANELEPPQLTLSPEAKELWKMFHNDVERQLASGERFHPIRPTASKAAEQALRIATALWVWTRVETDERTIPSKIMEDAIRLVSWYLNEALRISDSHLVDSDLQVAQKVLTWLVGKAKLSSKLTFTLRDCYRNGPREVRTAGEARKILRALEGHRWVVGLDQEGAHFELHPKACELCDIETIGSVCD